MLATRGADCQGLPRIPPLRPQWHPMGRSGGMPVPPGGWTRADRPRGPATSAGPPPPRRGGTGGEPLNRAAAERRRAAAGDRTTRARQGTWRARRPPAPPTGGMGGETGDEPPGGARRTAARRPDACRRVAHACGPSGQQAATGRMRGRGAPPASDPSRPAAGGTRYAGGPGPRSGGSGGGRLACGRRHPPTGGMGGENHAKPPGGPVAELREPAPRRRSGAGARGAAGRTAAGGPTHVHVGALPPPLGGGRGGKPPPPNGGDGGGVRGVTRRAVLVCLAYRPHLLLIVMYTGRLVCLERHPRPRVPV